jgi:hypothetical protein
VLGINEIHYFIEQPGPPRGGSGPGEKNLRAEWLKIFKLNRKD